MPISDALDKVMALRGVSYTMKSNGDNAIPVIEYGFIAQEAESVIKNISEKGDKGYLGMDYDEVIPFLVEAIKEQQAIIEDMRLNCCHSEKSSIQAPSQSDENNVVDSPRLFQNKPNPYRESTQIEYYLPKNTMHAEILIFDLQGALVRTYKLSGTGTNVLRVDAASLKAGMYHYSLIVNDTVSDTKKMILTE